MKIRNMICSVLITLIVLMNTEYALSDCLDMKGRSVASGFHYIPGPDICQFCVCNNSNPVWCKRVLCSPPENCQSFIMGSSCCDYSCVYSELPSEKNERMQRDKKIAGLLFAFLFIICLILLGVHYVRTRDSRAPRRNVMDGRRDLRNFSVVANGIRCFPDGHHLGGHSLVHFASMKPDGTYLFNGEAPPPYEEAIADSAFRATVTTQLLDPDRSDLESSQHRCRSTSTTPGNNNSRRLSNDCCTCDNPQQEEGRPVHACTTQHRTIPLPAILSPDDHEQHCPISSISKRFCPVHDEVTVIHSRHQRSYRGQRKKRTDDATSSASSTEPQASVPEVSTASYHRTLPLAASLSSPLPSTSNRSEPSSQVTFLSVSNIPTVEKDLTKAVEDDYHAECENCNLSCDHGVDEYFEQETMTLHRKPHEAVNETANVSMTLPTNSRNKRCTLKHRNSNRYTRDSVIGKLEYVYSDEEDGTEKPNKEECEEVPISVE